jgi:ribosomal protein L13E
LSSKRRQVAEGKATTQTLQRPTAKPPTPRVMSRHGDEMIERTAKGFSVGELGSVSVPLLNARRMGVMVDPRRRSVLQPNVEALKGWEGHIKPQKRTTVETERLEEEVEKVEKAVKKEVAEVKKGVVKATRKVKKEASKAEKEVAGKVKKAKTTRPKKPSKKK